MTTFITSDTHFSHRNILHLGEGRPFESIEQHDNALANNWNTVVQPSDMVIHLGDTAFGNREQTLRIFERLNGIKILVPGNHDHVSSLFPKKHERWRPVYERHFDAIWPEQVVIEHDDVRMLLSHYPPQGIPDHEGKDRYAHMQPSLEGDIDVYVHGHDHRAERVIEMPNGSLAFSAGVDANSYTPISVDYILSEVETFENRRLRQAIPLAYR